MQNPKTLHTKVALFSTEFGIGAYKRLKGDFKASQLLTWNKNVYALQADKSVITKFTPRDGKHQHIAIQSIVNTETQAPSAEKMLGSLSEFVLQIIFIVGCIGI